MMSVSLAGFSVTYLPSCKWPVSRLSETPPSFLSVNVRHRLRMQLSLGAACLASESPEFDSQHSIKHGGAYHSLVSGSGGREISSWSSLSTDRIQSQPRLHAALLLICRNTLTLAEIL